MIHMKSFSGQSIGVQIFKRANQYLHDATFRTRKRELGLRIFILNIYWCITVSDISTKYSLFLPVLVKALALHLSIPHDNPLLENFGKSLNQEAFTEKPLCSLYSVKALSQSSHNSLYFSPRNDLFPADSPDLNPMWCSGSLKDLLSGRHIHAPALTKKLPAMGHRVNQQWKMQKVLTLWQVCFHQSLN